MNKPRNRPKEFPVCQQAGILSLNFLKSDALQPFFLYPKRCYKFRIQAADFLKACLIRLCFRGLPLSQKEVLKTNPGLKRKNALTAFGFQNWCAVKLRIGMRMIFKLS